MDLLFILLGLHLNILKTEQFGTKNSQRTSCQRKRLKRESLQSASTVASSFLFSKMILHHDSMKMNTVKIHFHLKDYKSTFKTTSQKLED